MAVVAQRGEVELGSELDELYDFAVRVTHDHDAASRVVQTVVRRAQEADTADVAKSWLYNVARDTALEELSGAKRRFAADNDEFVQGTDDDDAIAHAVWAAAAAFEPRDYALLDMRLRRGVDVAELNPRATMLCRTLEEVIFATALMAQGDCRGLQSAVDAVDGSKPTRELVRDVNRHAQDCDRCSETKQQLPAPLDVFAGLQLVQAPPKLREAVAAMHRGEAPTRRLRRTLAGVAAAIAVVALTAGLAWMFRAEPSAAPAKPRDPSDVRSTTHEIAVASRRLVVEITWSPQPGAAGYSISWTHTPTKPDRKIDLAAARSSLSTRLTKGEWWFNLRTRDARGAWTGTVHVGPFVIKVPARRPSKRKAPVVAVTPAPTFVPTPAPAVQPPKPKPTPKPAATQPTPVPPPTEPPPTAPTPTEPTPTVPPPTPTEPSPPPPPP